MNSELELQRFSDALEFFNEVRWIYNYPVKEVLVRRLLDSFPEGWLETLESLDNDELNDFVARKKCQLGWPQSLSSFLEKCKKTDTLPRKSSENLPMLPKMFHEGLSPKKQHEIVHLAHLVHLRCVEKNISTIVDLGAGLGYVCQLLQHLYDYRVLGLEANPQNVESAKNRQSKLYPDSLNSVKYVCCNLTGDSAATIDRLLRETFPDHGDVCLVGLHACGDLSVDMFKIYSNLKAAKSLILLSCCYHKLSSFKVDESEREYFNNFPVSRVFQEAVETSKLDVGEFLRRPFMRLACQESSDRWLGMTECAHQEHSFHVLARAILELLVVENGLRLEKLVQKGTRKSQCLNFETYLKDSMQRYAFRNDGESKNEEPSAKVIEEKTKVLWGENHGKCKAAEAYTALQMLLQSPAESLVLRDRLCWLREHGFSAEIVPVTNRNLSPRCHAIVSWKN